VVYERSGWNACERRVDGLVREVRVGVVLWVRRMLWARSTTSGSRQREK
jgi:hypothetical protein